MIHQYSKKHPLWPVYDFQKKSFERGGKLNRFNDLLAFFEGRSLEPNSDPENILKSRIINNQGHKVNNEGLYQIKKVFYKKGNFESWTIETDFSSYDKNSDKNKLKLNEETDKLVSVLNDNEFIVTTLYDHLVQLDKKYIDILRLIKNGYEPQKNESKKNINILSAIIIGGCIIIAMLVYVYSNRYEIDYPLRIDKWTGKMQKLEFIK